MLSKKSTIKYRPFAVTLAGILLILAGLAIYNNLQSEGASSPEEAWSQLVVAMQNQDLERIRALTTDKGFTSLQSRRESDQLQTWSIWANRWAEHEDEWLHWEQIDENTVKAFCCGQNESAFVFIRISGKWQLDELLRGA